MATDPGMLFTGTLRFIRDTNNDTIKYAVPMTVYTERLPAVSNTQLYNNEGEHINFMVGEVSGNTIEVVPFVTITTPFEEVIIPKGSTLAGKLKYLPGRSMKRFEIITGVDVYSSEYKNVVLDKYVYKNQIIDLNNTTFDADTTISCLYNMNTLASYEVSGTITTGTDQKSAGTVDHENYKGAFSTFNGLYVSELVYISDFSIDNRYELCVPYDSQMSDGTYSHISTTRKVYYNNTLFKTFSNTSYSMDITQSEYNNFPSSGTIKLEVIFSNPSSVSTGDYTWVATKRSTLNSDGYVFDWSVAPTEQEIE